MLKLVITDGKRPANNKAAIGFLQKKIDDLKQDLDLEECIIICRSKVDASGKREYRLDHNDLTFDEVLATLEYSKHLVLTE